MKRWGSWIVGVVLITLWGCGGSETTDEPEIVVITPPQARHRAAQETQPHSRETQRENPEADRRPGRSAFLEGGQSRLATSRFSNFDDSQATNKVLDIVRDSADFRPTLVVWIVDRSPSAWRWNNELGLVNAIAEFYQSLAAADEDESKAESLQTAVVTFGQDVQFVIETPTSSAADVAQSLEAIDQEPSGREMTFTAIKGALEKYLPVRKRQQREVIFFVITDEAGDDEELVDDLVSDPRKYGLPIYVIGVSAPFGRAAVVADEVEGGSSGEGDGARPPIRQGPESVSPERIHLDLPAGSDDPQMRFAIQPWELMDSGFGPYALERICHESGGTFFATRTDAAWLRTGASGGDWPARRYDAQTMRRYAPYLVSRAEYKSMVQENLACAALLSAARLPRTQVLDGPTTEFLKRDEANLVRLVNTAQRAAAEVEPAINQLYDVLSEGAVDREKISSVRFSAAFDLAYGRACASKVRVDGYNAMLAALKRGRPFVHESSNTWVLEMSDEIETGSSTRRIADRARELLERVISEHPGTPWADIAQAELRTPLGWKWSER